MKEILPELDFSKSNYINVNTKVTSTCIKHGDFENTPKMFLRGTGCFECLRESGKSNLKMTQSEFITKAEKLKLDNNHNTLDFSNTIYTSNKGNLNIHCSLHGYFEITTKNFMQGRGCPKCGIEKSKSSNLGDLDKLISRFINVHGNRYDYSKVELINNKLNVIIICKKHGEFLQSPVNHYYGKGCQKCANEMTTSSGELELKEYIKSIYDGILLDNSRGTIENYELDIFLPKLNIAIEYNGLYWHSEANKSKNYHNDKYNCCKNKGIRLVQIWEDEWRDNVNNIKLFLRNLILNPEKKYYARKLRLEKVDLINQRNFLSKNHFQGYVSSSVCFGLWDDNKLIQLMSLKKLNEKNYEISRLCTINNSIVIGGSERLFKQLKQSVVWDSIISYNNLDKFSGNTYEKLGMIYDSTSIGFFYTDNKIRFSRQKFQKKKLIKSGIANIGNGNEMARSIGLYRVFTSGNSKWVINK